MNQLEELDQMIKVNKPEGAQPGKPYQVLLQVKSSNQNLVLTVLDGQLVNMTTMQPLSTEERDALAQVLDGKLLLPEVGMAEKVDEVVVTSDLVPPGAAKGKLLKWAGAEPVSPVENKTATVEITQHEGGRQDATVTLPSLSSVGSAGF